MKSAAGLRTIAAIDWQQWQAVDPATLVFVLERDRVLLIRKKRGLGAGKINGPGGRLEPGETPEQCAVREVQEELRITPGPLSYRGDNLFQFVDGYSIHAHVFTTESFDGTPQETEEAIPLWTERNSIPYDEMWEDDRLWLPLALEGRDFRGRFVFDGDSMLDWRIETPDRSAGSAR